MSLTLLCLVKEPNGRPTSPLDRVDVDGGSHDNQYCPQKCINCEGAFIAKKKQDYCSGECAESASYNEAKFAGTKDIVESPSFFYDYRNKKRIRLNDTCQACRVPTGTSHVNVTPQF